MRIFLLSSLFMFSLNVHADYYDGNGLLALANNGDVGTTLMYRGYVAGVQDSFNGNYFCVPTNVRLNQSSEIILKYLNANPKQWHLAAKSLVIEALNDAFPCAN